MLCASRSPLNKRRHSDGLFVAAAPPLQGRACCGRYVEGGGFRGVLQFMALIFESCFVFSICLSTAFRQ